MDVPQFHAKGTSVPEMIYEVSDKLKAKLDDSGLPSRHEWKLRLTGLEKVSDLKQQKDLLNFVLRYEANAVSILGKTTETKPHFNERGDGC
ncbi:MAG: hypothetical protein HQ561_11425 [Desulfobacteraceae bacterium]|nr:hypothetical protein [Desulfobacteraceae bacterium]